MVTFQGIIVYVLLWKGVIQLALGVGQNVSHSCENLHRIRVIFLLRIFMAKFPHFVEGDQIIEVGKPSKNKLALDMNLNEISVILVKVCGAFKHRLSGELAFLNNIIGILELILV